MRSCNLFVVFAQGPKTTRGRRDTFEVLEESRNGWLSSDLKARKSLKERKMRLRKTKVVCTIGPSSASREALFKLCDAGMNVARLNMSHGDHESHKQVRLLNPQPNRTNNRYLRRFAGTSAALAALLVTNHNQHRL
eukprot:4317-Pyramimonas_sp.AAC.1